MIFVMIIILNYLIESMKILFKPFIEKFEKKYKNIFEKKYHLPEIKYCYKDNDF